MRLYKNGHGNPACQPTNLSNLFLSVNIIISGVNRIVKGKPLPQFYQFYFYIFVILPDDGRNMPLIREINEYQNIYAVTLVG
jgi:hypothetical protein